MQNEAYSSSEKGSISKQFIKPQVNRISQKNTIHNLQNYKLSTKKNSLDL